MSVWFVSDLHLDQSRPQHVAALRRLAEQLRTGDELFILGDLFEVWIGDDDDDPFARSVVELLRDAATRVSIGLLVGNRDFLIGERFACETGARLHPDPIVIERYGRRLLLSHGDAWCTRDGDYQRMRAVMRTEAWCSETLARPLAERREMARSLRAQSRAANANKSDNIMDVTSVEIDAAIRTHRADAVIHGHTHRPGIHAAGAGHAPRYVLGDWERCGWTLVLDADGFELRRFTL